MARCIELDIQCAALCTAAAELMSMGSAYSHKICSICAEICEECGSECEKHHNEHCRECAEICKSCAQQCREMAA